MHMVPCLVSRLESIEVADNVKQVSPGVFLALATERIGQELYNSRNIASSCESLRAPLLYTRTLQRKDDNLSYIPIRHPMFSAISAPIFSELHPEVTMMDLHVSVGNISTQAHVRGKKCALPNVQKACKELS